jgi:hypothetical protein
MHTTLVRPALRKPLQVQTVLHTAGNIHETHRHIFVFSVESLHLTAPYPLQLLVSPCHIVMVWNQSEHELVATQMKLNV